MAKYEPTPWAPRMKRVAVLPWPGIEGAFLCVSGKKRRQEVIGERWYPKNAEHREERQKWSDDFRSEPYISFTYVGKTCAAEWNGEDGPIQIFYARPKGWEEENGWQKATPHWIFDHASYQGCWSQLAVDEADLPRRFNEGDYEDIFRTLKQWVDSRDGDSYD